MSDRRKDRHIIEAMGKTRVIVEGGEVTELGRPLIEYCPLFSKYRDIHEISSEAVRENIEYRIRDFGMCTPRRQLRMRDFLSFGISELMAMSIREGIIHSAVTVCDGAGTVVITDPELIQGIGGRLSGVIMTSPIAQVLEGIGRGHVLDPDTASIDQFRGVEMAVALGYEKVGVTVADPEEARRIREHFRGSAVIFAVHLTGVDHEGAMTLFDNSDIVTACASLPIRGIGDQQAKAKVGSKIPVYAASELGKDILQMRMREIESRGKESAKSGGEEDSPRPLV